jgi:homoserine kinase
VVVHPELEIQTAAARALLGNTVALADAISQWANLAAFVHALHTGDYDLLGRALQDVIAEPKRASLVPGFADIKRAALDAGALGCSLSGSGPSLFALCRGRALADRVAAAMRNATTSAIGRSPHVYVSSLAQAGARVVTAAPDSCAS